MIRSIVAASCRMDVTQVMRPSGSAGEGASGAAWPVSRQRIHPHHSLAVGHLGCRHCPSPWLGLAGADPFILSPICPPSPCPMTPICLFASSSSFICSQLPASILPLYTRSHLVRLVCLLVLSPDPFSSRFSLCISLRSSRRCTLFFAATSHSICAFIVPWYFHRRI